MERKPSLIVGIGASAGGLKPIEDFFDNMPIDTGMAFVIVQHLSPDFKSLMDELLARHTKMSIHKVSDGVRIEPNSIYLIPPERNMSIENGKLLLTAKAKKPELHLPIDNFFESLAVKSGRISVAIVLSGTGSDGSRGIKQVREAGGLVMVQEPETAGFDGMPRAAIASGVVDLICHPTEMPERLIQYQLNFDRIAVQQTELESNGEEAGANGPVMLRLVRFFRQRNNIEFSLYKPGTIYRRLERRMRMSALHSLDQYFDKVENDNDEAELLYRDLLVEVTSFFRDKEAFARLRDVVVPEMVQKAETGNELRIWVCGCATGEEAYSIAIVVHQCIENSGRQDLSFKVFATDIHRKSLEVASSGFYPLSALDNVPKELQAKYFVRNNGLCNVRREIRQAVIFACNDITKDPPFTRVDLISCRNVLIYLEPKIQKRILSTFHFGLKKGGVLFLGPSETVGDLGNEFDQLDRHWRIYSKRRDIRLPEATRMPLTPVLGSVIHEQSRPFVAGPPNVQNQLWLTTAYDNLLAKHVPPSLLVNEMHELIHCFGNARKLLTLPEGKQTNDILKMLNKNLSISVSSALHRAKTEQVPVVYRGVRVQADDHSEILYQVTVEPYKKKDQSLFLIALEEMEKVIEDDRIVEDFQSTDQSNDRIAQLERELNYTRETLQATVEELESSNEELQATNEELIASNEELQSTNEELHSVNEELYTVNSEHKVKIEELTQLTSDMDNLLKSTEIGTIFLDRNFNIRMFTPAISAGFNVIEQDIGRPINHISYKLDSPQLLTDAAEVLKTGNPKELEVTGKAHRIYLQRIQPYRIEDKIDGIVLTLTDITELREAEKATETFQTLSEISQELPDFAYAVSNDLQAPLRHISQYTESLNTAIKVDNKQEISRCSRVLRTCADRLREMIDGLLAYSRINTHGKQLTAVSLSSPIRAAIMELNSAIEASGATVVYEDREAPTVLGDQDQLKLLFFHLIENAIKFRSDLNPWVTINTNTFESTVEVFVCDNGIGIDMQNADDIFTIFKRLGVKGNIPGAGIGLAMCRRIVLRHFGRIWVKESESGHGTVICFSLRQPDQSSQKDVRSQHGAIESEQTTIS